MSESSQNNTKNGKLLPCPFCGCEPSVFKHADDVWCIGCDMPDCMGYCETDYFETFEQAAEAWNTRYERIVRCKDCKYCIDSDYFQNPFCTFLNDQDVDLDDFCSWGERK